MLISQNNLLKPCLSNSEFQQWEKNWYLLHKTHKVFHVSSGVLTVAERTSLVPPPQACVALDTSDILTEVAGQPVLAGYLHVCEPVPVRLDCGR